MTETSGEGPAPLSVERVSLAFGTFRALDAVSFDVRAGEVACLLGHSGCGKSTMLRTVAGLETPQSGSISLGGRPLTGPGVFVPPERRGVGLMFQDYALFPHLTVLQNVLFGLRGLARRQAEARAGEALARVGLERFREVYPATLSGGEQQRVALARALAPRPALMLLDEPFSNLDRRTRDRIRDETLILLRQAGVTVVVVTHDPEEALPMADQVVLMSEGRIVQAGPGEDVFRRPNSLFAARFFGEWNEVEGLSRGGRVETPLGTFPCDLPEGARAVVGLRPHDLRVGEREGLSARVLGRAFLGPATLLDLAVANCPVPLRARLAQTEARPGEDIKVVVDSRAVIVLPAEDESGI